MIHINQKGFNFSHVMTDDWMNNDSVEKIYINSRSKLNFLGGYVTNLTTVLNLIFSLPNNSLNEIQNEV